MLKQNFINFLINLLIMLFLSQTLQAFYNPDKVLKELLRIGKSVLFLFLILAIGKFELVLLFFGKMPVTKTLPYKWYNTPNLHMCSIKGSF